MTQIYDESSEFCEESLSAYAAAGLYSPMDVSVDQLQNTREELWRQAFPLGSPTNSDSSKRTRSMSATSEDYSEKNSSRRKAVKKSETKPIIAAKKTAGRKPQNSQNKAHNSIEKRYRMNLNSKIDQLRDSVPSLRERPGANDSGSNSDDSDQELKELDGLTAAHKFNKATIFDKAIEYIEHLEKRNKGLNDGNVDMTARLCAFDKLVAMHKFD
jgi:Helix-loop-helix DNA-binding domain